jgi:hypothetical protein
LCSLSRFQQRAGKYLHAFKEQIQAARVSGKNSVAVSYRHLWRRRGLLAYNNAAKELAPNMAFMGVREEDPRIVGGSLCYDAVPDSMAAQGFRADQWVQAALATCEGRGRGKENNTTGQATENIHSPI